MFPIFLRVSLPFLRRRRRRRFWTKPFLAWAALTFLLASRSFVANATTLAAAALKTPFLRRRRRRFWTKPFLALRAALAFLSASRSSCAIAVALARALA